MINRKDFHQDERGLSAVEYGLVAVLLSLVIVAGASAAGTSLDSIFVNLANEIASAN